MTSAALQILAFVWHLDPSVRNHYLYQGHGLEQAAVYLGVTCWPVSDMELSFS